MTTPRLRVFAGPNGSGKSSLFDAFKQNHDPGLFLNADLIEKALAVTGYIDLTDFNIELTAEQFQIFLDGPDAVSLQAKSALNGHTIALELVNNIIINKKTVAKGYEGALITTLLREKLLEKRLSFSFETVMSHSSKIDFLTKAKHCNYKTYLYFICIDDPEVNKSRVLNRVEKGGHAVEPDKIEKRYFQTLQHLIAGIEAADKSFLFDNSGPELQMIASIMGNELQILVDSHALPTWFIVYVLPHYEP